MNKIKQKLFLVHYIRNVIYVFNYLINGLINTTDIYIYIYMTLKIYLLIIYYVQNDKIINIENDVK